MQYRDIGCPDCRNSTTGDCGKHGQILYGSVTPAQRGFTIDEIMHIARAAAGTEYGHPGEPQVISLDELRKALERA